MRLSTDLTDDSMDVKAFMELYEIRTCGAEHDRIARIFEEDGFIVFKVERTSYCWALQIFKNPHPHPPTTADQLRRHFRSLLHKHGIRTARHEPLLTGACGRVWVYFDCAGGEIGLGLQVAETRRGEVFPCRQEYRLEAYECDEYEPEAIA